MKSSVVGDVAVLAKAYSGAGAVESAQADLGLIGHVQVSLAAQVGTVCMSVERLFGLKSGDVISMNELVDAPVTLMLDGRAVARAELLAVDDYFGVRILELA